MLYTEKTLKTLEFDKIREMLASCALTEGAKEAARALAASFAPSVRAQEASISLILSNSSVFSVFSV